MPGGGARHKPGRAGEGRGVRAAIEQQGSKGRLLAVEQRQQRIFSWSSKGRLALLDREAMRRSAKPDPYHARDCARDGARDWARDGARDWARDGARDWTDAAGTSRLSPGRQAAAPPSAVTARPGRSQRQHLKPLSRGHAARVRETRAP